MRNILKGLAVVWLFSSHLVVLSAGEPWVGSAKALKTVTLDVRNMDCPVCKTTIRKALEMVDGVKETKVDYDTRIARVTFDPAASRDLLIKPKPWHGQPIKLSEGSVGNPKRG